MHSEAVVSKPAGFGVCGDCATTLPHVYVDSHCCGGDGHAGACALGLHGQMTSNPEAWVGAEQTWPFQICM